MRVIVTFPVLLVAGCCATPHPIAGTPLQRAGDEIMVAGQLFHTGTRVVLWTDPNGYDAYRTERRFAPWDKAQFGTSSAENPQIAANGPARFGPRKHVVDGPTFDRVRGGGWDLATLQDCVDQFVIHYDCCGTSRLCFKVLHDDRALSVHFMLDLDGTIYQTLDVKERAWHATRSNDRSVGIEIANMGAYQNVALLGEWYHRDADGHLAITIPQRFGDGGILDKTAPLRPARDQLITGQIQNTRYAQYDFTPRQYDALIHLTATLCTALPKINCDAPRDEQGHVIDHVLDAHQWSDYQGVLGHYHVDKNKEDPGPAFDWNRLLQGARALMTPEALAANRQRLGHPVKALP